jgi:hypothetical protein
MQMARPPGSKYPSPWLASALAPTPEELLLSDCPFSLAQPAIQSRSSQLSVRCQAGTRAISGVNRLAPLRHPQSG